MENFRSEIDLKEKDHFKLNSIVNNVEESINSVRLELVEFICSTNNLFFLLNQVKKKFTEYDDKMRHCAKEIDEFRDLTENLTIYLNTDVTGKINGILKFLGVSLIVSLL